MCSKFGHALPVILIILTTLWSYYVYVYEMCWLLIESAAKKWTYFAVFNLFFFTFFIMYLLTSFHRQWYVPDEYFFPMGFYDELTSIKSETGQDHLLLNFCKNRNLRVYTRTARGTIRVCHECKLLKPDRAHHCSVCDTCVIRMDHHCPWVNNCIGFTNYKYFMILVLYGSVYCTYYCATSTEYVVVFFMNLRNTSYRQINIVAATAITLVLGIALWSLFGFHISLIMSNETTIEAIHQPVFSNTVMVGFDMGKNENWKEVCSSNCCLWWLPVNTLQGDGVQFDVARY